MGLAFPSISSYPATPFFNTLIGDGAVSAGQFSFKLATSGSSLFLGGADSSLYKGPINWNSVTQQVRFSLLFSSLQFKARPVTHPRATRATGKLHLMQSRSDRSKLSAVFRPSSILGPRSSLGILRVWLPSIVLSRVARMRAKLRALDCTLVSSLF
jgi:Eukaryotic aspartyl protease